VEGVQQQLSIKLAITPAAFESVKSDVLAKLAKLLGLAVSRIQVNVVEVAVTNLIQTSSLTLLASSVAVGTLDGMANETALLVSILPATEPDQTGLGEKAAQILAAQSPAALSATLGVPVASVARQPDVLVASVPPPVETNKDWVYILVGVVGGVVVALAIAGGVYYQRSRRQSEAPHLPTSYKQKQAMQQQRRDRSDSYYSDEDEGPSIGLRAASNERKKSYQYGAVGVC